MTIVFDKSFFKYLKKLNLSNSMKQKLKSVIEEIEQAKNIIELNTLKKLLITIYTIELELMITE